MGHFMDVGEQKQIRVEIMVQCDAWTERVGTAGEVTNLGLPAFSEF
jgi:hypothetical protein